MKSLSREEADASFRDTFTSINSGTFFTRQIGASFPPIFQLFYCVGTDDSGNKHVIEVSGNAFQQYMLKVPPPFVQQYEFDVTACINIQEYVDLKHPSAVEQLEMWNDIQKKQKIYD